MRLHRAALWLLLGGLALGSKPRLRLERIDASDFPGHGRLRLYASVVELEGEVDPNRGGFTLLVDGQPAGRSLKVSKFQGSGEPVDVVLVVESSALYGPQKISVPTPAPPPPPPFHERGKHDKKTKKKRPPPPPARIVAPPPRIQPGEEPLIKVKAAVQDLLDSLRGVKARAFVIDYGGDVTTHPPFRAPSAARSLIEELTYDDESGDVHMVDAIRSALLELGRAHKDSPFPPRRLVVVVSDGLNSQMDRKTFRDVGDAAAKAGVPIHSIAFSPNDDRGPLINLGEVSKRSNGTFRWARTADELKAQIDTLVDEVNQQYVLTFALDEATLDGKTFKLQCGELTSNPLKTHGTRSSTWYLWLLGVVALSGSAFAGRAAVLWFRRRPARAKRVVAAPPAATGAAPATRGLLVVLSGAHAGQELIVGAQPIAVGKGPGMQLVLREPSVSTRHAQIYRDPLGFVVADMGSTNGTFVNNQRIQQPTRLSDGDLVRFGEVQTKFRVER